MFLLWRNAYSDVLPILKLGCFFFLLLSFERSLYSLDTSLSSDTRFPKVFFHCVGCFFTLLIFNFDNAQCHIVAATTCACGVGAKEPLPDMSSGRLIIMCSSKSLVVLVLTLRSLIHPELIFVDGVRQWSNLILLQVGFICLSMIY